MEQEIILNEHNKQECPPKHTVRCKVEQDDILDFQKLITKESFRHPKAYMMPIAGLLFCVSLLSNSGLAMWYLYIIPYLIAFPIGVPFIWRKNTKKAFNRMKDMGQLEYEIRFYDAYFVTTTAAGWQKTEYEQLNKICVSDNALFLMPSPSSAIIVPKDSLTDEILDFLISIQTASPNKNAAKKK